ncbi:MAG: hypothetical protein M3R36_07025 [Bacteroidota bacterium]|nr:hypothetical protein [Bacteroidota bacterium]
MKSLIIKILFLTLLFTNLAYSDYQIPTYKFSPINASNINLLQPNILEFDIVLTHTNPGFAPFIYSMGQYTFYFNTGFANGGTLTYSYAPVDSSDLPPGLRPVNPKIVNNQLRLAPNMPPGPCHGYIISSTNGTLIARMRLRTTAASFALPLTNLNLTFSEYYNGGFYTKIVASVMNDSNTSCVARNITTPIGFDNLATGKVFFDDNNNGIKDFAELPFRGGIIASSPFTSYATTNNNGNYYMFCGQGNGSFNLSVVNVPLHYSVNPPIHTAIFSGNTISEGHDFALIKDTVNDLRIILTNGGAIRPGFNFNQYINIENIGNTTLSGNVVLLYDARFTYLPNQTFPSHTSHNPSAHTLSWNYSNLFPTERKLILVAFNLPSSVPIGTSITSTATIYPVAGDYNPSDNVSVATAIVTGSYDPNDKSVDLIGNITPQSVADEDSLTYTIRFQNTGTDTAFTVRVLDTLSSKVNVPTFEMLASSHASTYAITGAGIVEWTFDNILLPDSTRNELRSHGFIKYRIRPKNNLFIGDEIKNTAHIYFDYNLPVATNTVNTVVAPPVKSLGLIALIEGFYNNVTNIMIGDTTRVYLRNVSSPFNIIDSAKSVLDQNGNGTFNFSNTANGIPYFIVLKHRSSIETWSSVGQSFTSNSLSYDFTTNSSQAYGNNMIQKGSRFCIYSGDVNQDGVVDLTDNKSIDNDLYNFVSGHVSTDLNGDNFVDINDVTIGDNNAFYFVSVIRP